jgi:uncharacterized protein
MLRVGEDAKLRGWRNLAGFCAICVLALFGWLVPPVKAQDASGPDIPAWTQSYINPFPEAGTYKLYVIGDFLAAGLAEALPEALEEDATVEIVRETRNASGLARPDSYDWSARIRSLLASGEMHIAVVMLGSNDRRKIRTAQGFKEFGSDAWAAAYRTRVDSIIKQFTEEKVAVYWMGLPIVADEEARADYEKINDIIRERAYLGGIKYVDSWNGFSDQFGNYSAFGPSVDGVTKRLRDANGIGFTAQGNRKLAEFAASVIKRDLAAARQERSIPLAGDKQQQEQIARLGRDVPRSRVGQEDTGPSRDDEAAVDGAASAPFMTETVESEAPGSQSDGESTTSVRGASSRAVSFSDYSPPGEQLAIDIGDNLTALATISPANILSARGARQQLPLSQRLYYRVLVQGEKLNAPEGRVDNYQWEGG